ncbi:MAG: hypothetical protein U0802_15205 [Candidatus Binatia bacterium]
MHSEVNTLATRLPARRRTPPARSVETGTSATSGCAGRSPRAARKSRRAPATSASSTSLTVAPVAARTTAISASGSDAVT